MRHLHPLKKLWQDSCWKAWLPLIEIASKQLNSPESAPLQLIKHCEQGILSLPPGKLTSQCALGSIILYCHKVSRVCRKMCLRSFLNSVVFGAPSNMG